MYWVWNHSQSKGTGRHVMLACANWITGPDCTVRASTADLVQFSNAARSSVIKAVDALVKSGELHILEEARGTRPALYRIPGAVGYTRPERGSRGPKTGPLGESQQSGIRTSSPEQGSENETSSQNARGPESGPQGSENETPRGPKTGPHQQHHYNQSTEGATDRRQRDALREAQPLIDAMTDAGINVSWTMRTDEGRDLLDLIDRVDIPILVKRAIEARRPGQPVQYATWFLRGTWRGLPTTKGRTPPSRDSPPAQAGPHCGDIDCHPTTRLREVEDDDGLPVLIPCAICHPHAQGARK